MNGAKFKCIIFIWILLKICFAQKCPEKCTCTPSQDSEGFKVHCLGNQTNKITSIKELNFNEIKNDILQLDLSKNQINLIESNDLMNMTNLRKLDLSSNSLKQIDEYVFPELRNLEWLKLSQNLIVHIYPGSFNKLPSLKLLDISGNALACDCDLVWLVPWSTKMAIKLKPVPKCATPSLFSGISIRKLKIGTDFHCESPLQLILEMKPNQDQLVFEGDALTLQCRAPRVAVSDPRDSEDLPGGAHVFWGWSDKIVEPGSTENIIFHDPTLNFTSIQLETRHLSDSGLLDSILKIPYVTKNHTGMWDCRLRSQQANSSRNISIVVISKETKYCSEIKTVDNKGSYFWPRTIRGKTVQLPCVDGAYSNAYAFHICNSTGFWTQLDTSQCPYIKESTKILEQFSKLNLSITRGSAIESAKRLKNYTIMDSELVKLSKFRDPFDIVFIARTIKNYLDYVSQEKDLGAMVLDILSQISFLPYDLFQTSQHIDGSCNKFVSAAEYVVEYTLSAQAQKPNIALEFFKLRTDNFNGITCSWLRKENQKIFQCNTAVKGQNYGLHEKNIDALIQLPSSLLSKNSMYVSPQTLLVGVFGNSKFFPQNKTTTNFQVTSSIIGAKISNRSLHENLTDPIYVMLRPSPYHNSISQPRPVWWNPEINSGLGGWSLQGCSQMQIVHEMMVFSCNKLGYYGLIQNVQYLNDFDDENAGARFRLSPPAIYVGGLVLFILMWFNIVTYLLYGNSIQIARRTKHAFVNMCLAISLLTGVFTLGIFQTEDYKLCQGFGVAIHYFSLCVLLWLCVNVSNMYKRLSKIDRNNMTLPTDDGPKEHVGRRPILGLYLVGWGIAMIICGISGAVHVREYASYSYCFLKSGPALSAIFVPAAIVIICLLVLFVCIRCHLRNSGINGHMSEGTQATDNVDLDLLDSTHLQTNNIIPIHERCQSLSICTPTTTTNIDDQEHSMNTQLNSNIIILLLFISTWLAGAITVSLPFADKRLYEEELFSIIFAILAILLGVFITFYYAISRSDVRILWGGVSCYNCNRNNKNQCCLRKSVSDSKELKNGPIVAFHATNTVQSVSISNSQNSKNYRSDNKNGNQLNCHNDNHIDVINNSGKVDLVLLHRQQFVHNPVVTSSSQLDIQSNLNTDIFYNPNQINVARKFFRKQKRLAKQNNIEIQRNRPDYIPDNKSDVSSVLSYPAKSISIFGGGSKVNNTNIHVDRKHLLNDNNKDAKQHMNPNILSDSCNESDLIIDPERFVLGSESLRAYAAGHRINIMNNKINNTDSLQSTSQVVANIYTNVSETGKPSHEIITVRNSDKRKSDDNSFFDTTLEDVTEEDEENNLNNPIEKSKINLFLNSNHSNNNTNNTNYRNNIDVSPVKNVIDSMLNTIGLPIIDTPPNEYNLTDGNIDLNLLNLDKNKTYISPSLEISGTLLKSKSLENVTHFQFTSKNRNFHTVDMNNETRSISCNNLLVSLSADDNKCISNINSKIMNNNTSHSPILFSPSLCDIDDLSLSSPSVAISQNKSLQQNEKYLLSHHISTRIDHELNLASSPTSESDINYQNSELSIHSHGLYAPQPNDNDLNLTLTCDDTHYQYQPSELSDDMDEDENVDHGDHDVYNCSRNLLSKRNDRDEENMLNDSQSSIDELYQQITRRNQTRHHLHINNHRNREFINDNDEENSQCSVVAYVEPMLLHNNK